MNKIPKELRVGLLTLFTLFVLYEGVDFLKGSALLRSNNILFLVFDRVDGLQEGNNVMLNGTTVGTVQKLSLQPGAANRVVVQMEIQKDLVLDKATKGILNSSGLLGGQFIELQPGKGKGNWQDGDTLASETAQGLTNKLQEEAKPFLNTAENSLKEVSTTLKKLNETLTKADVAITAFTSTANGVNGLMADNKDNLHATTENIAKLTKDFGKTEQELRKLLTNMNKLSDTLSNAQLGKTLANAQSAIANLNKMLANINQGQGTMGKLAKNDSLYRNLNATAASLDALLKDFKANPKRYVHFSVFGRKEK